MYSKKYKYFQVAAGVFIQLFLPVILFYLLELYEHNPFQEVRPRAQLFNVLILELLGWGLFFAFKKARVSLSIITVFCALFGLVNHYVMRFRSTPFVPWDIFSIRTAVSVAENYDFRPELRVIAVTEIFIMIFMLLQYNRFSCIGVSLHNVTIKKKFLVFAYRFCAAVCCFAALAFLVRCLQDDAFQQKHYLYPFLFTPAYMTQVDGMLVTFAMNLEYVTVDKPSGYSEEGARQILSEYESPSGGEKAEKPNIIVIMDEAFSDPGILSEFRSNKEYMPFVNSVLNGEVENTVSGYLNVSVCGGNTANTEFEFLTGNTMAFLPSGSIPYQQYISGSIPSLAGRLADMGYETYGIHPYYAQGWSRDKVYPRLGFEHTLFLDEFEERAYLRQYMSDACDFRKLVSIYEKNKESRDREPLFLFNVTMQNHGSYTDAYQNFTPDITVDGSDDSDSLFSLEQYLSLIRVTDSDIQNLIAYFEGQDEDTVIVFFGDHQPNDFTVSGINRAKKEYERYEVPYFIWANFDIEDETDSDISANYLAAKMMQTVKLPTDAYQNFLLQIQKKYPICSAVRLEDETTYAPRGKAGGSVSDGVSPADGADQMLEDYKKLQYYHLFDYGE